jgi:hypothetical protein
MSYDSNPWLHDSISSASFVITIIVTRLGIGFRREPRRSDSSQPVSRFILLYIRIAFSQGRPHHWHQGQSLATSVLDESRYLYHVKSNTDEP